MAAPIRIHVDGVDRDATADEIADLEAFHAEQGELTPDPQD